jgi:NAD(P)H-flavin reductase
MSAPTLHSYLPARAEVTAVLTESSDTRTFLIEPREAGRRLATARPGQFVMLSLPGHGEAAFTLASAAGAVLGGDRLALTVRRVGRLTTALFDLEPGASVGLRGPFGRGFPEWPLDASILFVAGGCGIVPLKAAIERRISEPLRGGAMTIVYGARDPASRIYRKALERWRHSPGVTVLEGVEHRAEGWSGRVGNVGDLLEEALRAPPSDFAAVCGPPVMMAFVARRLRRDDTFSPSSVHLAIERQMKCGVGTCGRCYVGNRYACRDGPVFSLAELADLDPAFAGGTPRSGLATAGGLQC